MATIDESNHQHIPEQLIAVSVILLVIGSILVGLRIYALKLKNAPLGWNDYLLPPSWLFLVGLVIINILYFAIGGAGKSSQFTLDSELTIQARLIYALYWIYPISSTLPRLSVLALYLRIFTHKLSRALTWIVMAFILAHCIATIIVNNVLCIPLASILTFDHNFDSNQIIKCIDWLSWWQFSNIPNIIADVAILLLPIHTIWTLKMSMGKKVGIAIVCVTGSVGLAASCIRTSQVFSKVTDNMDINHYTDNYYILFMWATAECGLYLWAACLIGLRPVLSKVNLWASKKWSILRSSEGKTAPNCYLKENTIALKEVPGPSKSSTKTDFPEAFFLHGNDVNIEGSAYHRPGHNMDNDSGLKQGIAVETQVIVDIEPGRHIETV